jgi:hypothetical protein
LSAFRNDGSRNGWPTTNGCSDKVITNGLATHCSTISSNWSTIMSANCCGVFSRWMIEAESFNSAG